MTMLCETAKSEAFNPEASFVLGPGEFDPGETRRPEDGKSSNISRAKSITGAFWIDPERAPKAIQLHRKVARLPDMFCVCHGRPVVRDTFKAVVEELEPGVHQFLPVAILPKKNCPEIEGEFFLFNIMHKRECVLISKTDHDVGEISEGKYYYHVGPYPTRQIGISKPQVEGLHIWRSPVVLTSYFFISDALRARIKQAGLKKYTYLPYVKEYDEPWVLEDNISELMYHQMKDYYPEQYGDLI